tara:strand:- start:1138 stop:1500 length:363 start_codon:yes stop_codon:yes gene_type:complete
MKYLALFAVLLMGCTQAGVGITGGAVSDASFEEPSHVQTTVRIIDQQPDISSLSVEKGDKISMEVVNKDSERAVFMVEYYGEILVPANGVATISFTADKKGSFAYGIRDSTVKGTLFIAE